MFLDVPTPSEDSFTLAVKHALHLALTENSVAVPATARILLAFSGGPDSTALLTAMAQFANEHPFELHACHINHGLRGEESDGDEEYCRQICDKWQIPLYTEKLAGTNSKAEAELRNLRYECLERIASKINAVICLTGHTLDDQVETMLFRLFRGTGPSGLLGIPACREISDKLIVVRPMLGLNRNDCMAF
ncbi:MAG: tRNA lysidine(34) synthetase TilS [Candidatus Obscuribacterales bacterium]|nr:tRNA lysidine(34) synthetase TilS [Candidatus Obscuribacterales bacterium]